MIRTKFSSGRMFDEIKESIDAHERNIKRQLKTLGDETAKKMKDVIASNKVRPQAGEPTSLENNIEVEHFSNDSGWGVGEIEKLNQNVKYWRAINHGSKHLVGKTIHGKFEPGEQAPNSNDGRNRTGRLKSGYYTIHIKNPIPPMNYIEKTVNFVRRQINKLRMAK